MVASNANLESFAPATHHGDASNTFVHAAYEGLLGPTKTNLGETPEYLRQTGPAPGADRSAAPAGVDAASWAQVSQMIGDGKNVQFTTASDNAANNNAQPDFILGADGVLRPNTAKTTPPSADGKVNIQVGDANSNQQAAKQAAQQLQVAAVQEKISYWRRSHPNSADIPDFLKGELNGAQNSAGPGLQRADDQAFNRLKFPEGDGGAQITNPEQPAAGDDSAGRNTGAQAGDGGGNRGGGGGDGGNRGGGGGGGGSDYHGLDNPGQGPSNGYTDGQFDPGQKDNTPMPQAVAGDMSILIDPNKGPSCTVEQIQKFLDDHHSPAAKEIDPSNGKSFAQNLYDSCTARNLDPGAAVGFFLQESTLGLHGRAVHNHGFGNIKGRDPESGQTDGTFRHYESWSAGARDWAKLIDEKYVHGRNATTLGQIISVYAPSSDGNNVHGYVGTVKGVVTAFRNEQEAATPKAAQA